MAHIQDRIIAVSLGISFFQDHQADIVFDWFDEDFREHVIHWDLHRFSTFEEIDSETLGLSRIGFEIGDSLPQDHRDMG